MIIPICQFYSDGWDEKGFVSGSRIVHRYGVAIYIYSTVDWNNIILNTKMSISMLHLYDVIRNS